MKPLLLHTTLVNTKSSCKLHQDTKLELVTWSKERETKYIHRIGEDKILNFTEKMIVPNDIESKKGTLIKYSYIP